MNPEQAKNLKFGARMVGGIAEAIQEGALTPEEGIFLAQEAKSILHKLDVFV